MHIGITSEGGLTVMKSSKSLYFLEVTLQTEQNDPSTVTNWHYPLLAVGFTPSNIYLHVTYNLSYSIDKT